MNVKQNTIANGAIAFLTVLTVTLAQCALFAGAAVTFDEDRWTTMSMNNPVQGHSLSFSAVSAHWLENEYGRDVAEQVTRLQMANKDWLPLKTLAHEYSVSYRKSLVSATETTLPCVAGSCVEVVSSAERSYSGAFNRGASLVDPAEIIIYEGVLGAARQPGILRNLEGYYQQTTHISGELAPDEVRHILPLLRVSCADSEPFSDGGSAQMEPLWWHQKTYGEPGSIEYLLTCDDDNVLLKSQYWLYNEAGRLVVNLDFVYRYDFYYLDYSQPDFHKRSSYPTKVYARSAALSPHARLGSVLQSERFVTRSYVFECDLIQGFWFVTGSVRLSSEENHHNFLTAKVPYQSVTILRSEQAH